MTVNLKNIGGHMTGLDFLRAELADIERMDHLFWQTEHPGQYEKLGYLVGKDRRRELITELVTLMQSSF
jgi:hypothetical protein